ncbi:hypothetical protein LTR02_016097 [Friedmanniomyces endolithicus]|nr:hypothetical protein LTR94_016584 [Friedmanniomyces endolithicus]KAK0775278.1 hypothetical protein LTR59_014580 [Friedmanniomyces endolithicus]KAK0792925.1 hypothetical protein LTR75_011333 [Friedmanniomyces endolithicus]KAK0794441.1 hypothetical protein LTR38_009202 [Friedmanniomyces endolithicus]KAK0840432.1 hypothetical protein LTR03_010550 [Friedmanniomyces endolithicus]
MLDPLTAFSLAASIAAFVDFAKELCSDGYAIYKSGKDLSASNADIEERLLHVQDLEASVRASAANTYPVLSKNELKVQTLAKECQELSEKMLAVFDDLKVTSEGFRRVVAAARQSIRSRRKAKEVQTMMDKLDRLRGDVNTCLLLIIRDDQSTAMRHLSALFHTAKDLKISTAQQFAQAKSELLDAVESQGNDMAAKVGRIQPAIALASGEAKADFRLLSAKLDALLEGNRMMTRYTHILKTLHYHGIFDRQTSISSTYGKTGHWIFDPQRTPFEPWLQHGHGIFWICGKPGSGKSTLMSFLSEQLQTDQRSRLETSGLPVIVVSFFFWNAGTELQRSQEGLLRSLLFQILRECPDLIPIACSERWAQVDGLRHFEEPWTRKEVRQAFDRVVHQKNLQRNFFILIDGLDEFSKDEFSVDHYALIQDLKALSSSPYVKLCVSSRPWNSFREAFGNDSARCTVVESNTRKDMAEYVDGVLLADPRFETLIQRDSRAQRLVEEIRERSQGVFLWVFLAVRSLLRGLGEHDDVETLLDRLRELPPELERLFERILGSVEPVYRQHQAQLLLLVAHSSWQLPTLAVWHLRREARDPGFALHCPNRFMDSEELKHVQAEACLLVNSWCRDLLDVVHFPEKERQNEDASTRARISSSGVVTQHRTVSDYLNTTDVQQTLSAQAGPGFDPLEMACYLYLAQITVLHPDLSRPEKVQDFFNTCHDLMIQACYSEMQGQRPPMEVLSRMDELGEETRRLSGYRCCHWSKMGTREEQQKLLPEVDFAAYTLSYGLRACIEAALIRDSEFLRNSHIPYLYFALRQLRWDPNGLDLFAEPDIFALRGRGPVRYLLRNGSDPHQVIHGHRPSRPWRVRREEIQRDKSLGEGKGPVMDRPKDRSDTPETNGWGPNKDFFECRHHELPAEGKRETVMEWVRRTTSAEYTAAFEAIITSVEAEKVALTTRQSNPEQTMPTRFHNSSFWETSLPALGFPLWARTVTKHVQRRIQ